MVEFEGGIRRQTFALPLGIDHVHCYLLPSSDGGWTAVDTGLGVPDAGARWAAALEGLRRYSGTFHHLGQRRVDLDGDEATGEVYCQAHHFAETDGRREDRVVFIRYQDAYVRRLEGWRFASRRLEVDWVEERMSG